MFAPFGSAFAKARGRSAFPLVGPAFLPEALEGDDLGVASVGPLDAFEGGSPVRGLVSRDADLPSSLEGVFDPLFDA